MLQAVTAYLRERGRSRNLRARFTAVHDRRLWGAGESRSGPGSGRDAPSVALAAAALLRAQQEHGFHSLNDIPCGDFNWMPEALARLAPVRYIGFDIVRAALQRNRERHPGLEFRLLDITAQTPPRADLIFCKDLFNHLSDDDIRRALRNMRRSGATWLLASNNPGAPYVPLPDGPAASRHLDLTAPPFACPPPLWTLGDYMSLWRLADL
jgi:hypothetical protein